MAQSGFSPRPTALKVLHGVRPARINQNEPQPREMPLVAPDWLSTLARAEWDRVAPELEHMKVAKGVDSVSLAAYCEAVSRFRVASSLLAQTGPMLVGKKTGDLVRNPMVIQVRDASRDLLRWAREFGFTPSARSPLQIQHSGSIDGPTSLAQLLG